MPPAPKRLGRIDVSPAPVQFAGLQRSRSYLMHGQAYVAETSEGRVYHEQTNYVIDTDYTRETLFRVTNNSLGLHESAIQRSRDYAGQKRNTELKLKKEQFFDCWASAISARRPNLRVLPRHSQYTLSSSVLSASLLN